MKKLLMVLGATVAVAAFTPATVSAHGYSDDKDSEYTEESDWNTDRCEKIGYKLEKLNTNFDQSDQDQLNRQQRLINRASELGCDKAGTVVDTLVNNGNFTTLVAAVQAAGLAETLSAPGELTVFAPTDQAFAALPAGTVESLLADIPTLTKVLTNHVVAGEVDAVAAYGLDAAPMLSGNSLAITTDDWGNLYIGGVKVIVNDIYTTNGVVHVIDAVLVP